MPVAVLAPEQFREEASRRLIDAFELMLLLGLRNKQAVWARVERGTLPPPVINKERIVALWDRDEVATFIEA